MPRKVGPWEVDDEGNLSDRGQTNFPLYDCEGHVMFTRYATYKLVGDKVHSTIHEVPEISQ